MWPMLTSLWLALSGKPARKAASRCRPAFRCLLVEALEDRAVPSGSSLAAYGQLPLSFEANQGQTATPVNYLARGQGYTLFLAPTRAVLALSQGAGENVLQMQLAGANPAAQAVGLARQAGVSNYLFGSDPSQWITNVPHFGQVEYQGIYPGINLVYYGNSQTQLEYDFDVAPGATPAAIQLAFQGTQGITLDGQGNLVVHSTSGDVTEQAPVAYQVIDAVRQAVAAQYVLEPNGHVGFQLGAYDPSQAVVIDPVLSYATYLGGSTGTAGEQEGFAIAVDSSGDAYVTGATPSTSFPTTVGAFQTTGGGGTFVTKFNPSGTGLVYSTYLGPATGYGIAVNSAGDAYITGATSNPNFPTTPGAFQTTFPDPLGGTSAFVTELNATGSALVYSTFLGSAGPLVGIGTALGGEATGIALDSAGDAYVTGYTYTTTFPTTAGAFQTTAGFSSANPGDENAFVTELNPSGSALVYSSYLGGSSHDVGTGIAVDSAGEAYLTGYTTSNNFPTTAGAFQTALAGTTNAFVTKVNAGGKALVYSTYLGGSGQDGGSGIAVDSGGNAYITGATSSTNFPTTATPFQTTNAGAAVGGKDAFVTELNASGSGLVYSSFLGGSAGNRANAIAVDGAGDAYVTGWTAAPNFPTTANAFQATATVGAFVTEFNGTGSALVYSTYFGGTNQGNGIAVDSAGSIYVTGQTLGGLPTPAGAFETTYIGTGNVGEAFVAKFAAGPSFAVSGFPSPTTAGTAGTITVTALNADGTTDTGYTGTVHFTSSDPQAVLPADYIFTAADQGVHTFTATLKTAGTQSIAATDTVNSSTVGNDAGITVTPAAAASLAFSNVPANATAGGAFSLAVWARDAYGNTATSYTGTVHFTSSDARAALPADYTLTGSDAGSHTFSVTLKTAGSQSLTATDTATGSLTAPASGIVVNPAAAATFILSAPASVTHGVAFTVTLTVEDTYGNVVTGYTGTVHFRSSDSTATLPANYTFTAADAGVHTFTRKTILRKRGKQTLTVTDTLNSGLTATVSISVV
jgi:hypothetical protein